MVNCVQVPGGVTCVLHELDPVYTHSHTQNETCCGKKSYCSSWCLSPVISISNTLGLSWWEFHSDIFICCMSGSVYDGLYINRNFDGKIARVCINGVGC